MITTLMVGHAQFSSTPVTRPLARAFVARAFAFAVLAVVSVFAGPATAQTFDHSHAALTALLKKHVVVIDGGKTSQVDYVALMRDRAQLKAYLAQLSAVKEADFNAWAKPRRMAFLINAYNGFTLELILQHYPVKSIKDIGGLLDNRWKRPFFTLFGQPWTLDKLEHDTLRKPGAYNEPRIHFAVNCASIGCPSLREEAYVAERLEAQLEEQTVRFLSDTSRNRFAGGKLEVSMIFNWFKDDWTSGYTGFNGTTAPIRSREEWFGRYAAAFTTGANEQALLRAGKLSISHLPYDWSLNGVASGKK